MDEILARIIKQDDGFHVVDQDGTVGDVCKLTDEGDKTIVLTPNASNRKYYNKAKAEAAIEQDGYCGLTRKDTIKISNVTRTPNAKLISYLPQDLQDEYNAIIARAIEAKNASKKKPMTEREKLEAKLAKMQAQLAAMDAETVTEEN